MFKTQIRQPYAVRMSFQYFTHPLTFYFYYKISLFKFHIEQEESKRKNKKIVRYLKKK